MRRAACAVVVGAVVVGPARAATLYVPGQNEFGTVLIEDQWPSSGDLDYNDLVAQYSVQFERNVSSQVLSLVYTVDIQAVGATYDNGLALRIPRVPSAGVTATVLYGTVGDPMTAAAAPVPAQVVAGETDLVVVLADSVRATLLAGQAGFLNTEATNPIVEGVPVKLVLTFASPLPACNHTVPGDCTTGELDTAEAPFDLFLFRTGSFGTQVHRSRYPGTDAMTTALFGSGADTSDAGCASQTPGSRCFVTGNGLPSMLVIGEGVSGGLNDAVRYPLERTAIAQGMPGITTFASSGGASNADFYLTGLQTTYLFDRGSDANLPPVADLLPYCGDTAVDAVDELCDAGASNGLGTCTTRCGQFPAVTSHANGACAATSGTAKCWGRNNEFQTGSPTGTAITAPFTQTNAGSVTEAGYGIHFSCARAGGDIRCWGSSNGVGTFGTGSTSPASSASPAGLVTGISGTATQVAVGDEHACALLSTGAVKCWGTRTQGQLGNGGVGGSSATPVDTSLTGVAQVVANDHTSCARKSDGTVWCWGRNNNGQVGKGSASSACGGGGDTCEGTPRQVVGITDATFVAMGHKSVCALRSGPTKVSCWGHNDTGQFGTGTNTGNNLGPVAASNLPADIVDLAIGQLHACAVTASGAVYCWGDRASGKVGDGATTGIATPTLVTGIGPASKVAAGWATSCAVLRDGTVWCWGDDTHGQCGNGSDGTVQLTPVKVSNLP